MVALVGSNLEGLLANRDMISGLRTTAENLQSQLSSVFQTLHNAAFRDLPEQVQQQIISPMLSAAQRCTENFYQQLGVTSNCIEAIQEVMSGVPPSSGVMRNDQQQTPRQRRRANQINTPPQPNPRQANRDQSPTPQQLPAAAENTAWLDHLQNVVQFCQRNWKWIALGTVAGVAIGGKP